MVIQNTPFKQVIPWIISELSYKFHQNPVTHLSATLQIDPPLSHHTRMKKVDFDDDLKAQSKPFFFFLYLKMAWNFHQYIFQ